MRSMFSAFQPSSGFDFLVLLIGFPLSVVGLVLTGSNLWFLIVSASIGNWVGSYLKVICGHSLAMLVPNIHARAMNAASWILLFALGFCALAMVPIAQQVPALGAAVLLASCSVLLEVSLLRNTVITIGVPIFLVLVWLSSDFEDVAPQLLTHPVVQLMLGALGLIVLAQARTMLHARAQRLQKFDDDQKQQRAKTIAARLEAPGRFRWWRNTANGYGTVVAARLRTNLLAAGAWLVPLVWVENTSSSFLIGLLVVSPMVVIRGFMNRLSISWLYELPDNRLYLSRAIVQRSVIAMLPLFAVCVIHALSLRSVDSNEYVEQMGGVLLAQLLAQVTLLATFWSGRLNAHKPVPDSVGYTTGILLSVSVVVFAYSVDTVPYVPLLSGIVLSAGLLLWLGPYGLARSDFVSLSMKEEKDN